MTQQESYNERPDGESNRRLAGACCNISPALAAAIHLGEAELAGRILHTSDVISLDRLNIFAYLPR